ncbi:unnamed protein product [Polarella glacialis]|uniref:CS domain-containing protein n=2 Tax=Polarella glacialis TaxID=89957 RepID=A0A813GQV6_POLGL|nr:unnamed protein product [Polarella glacialis]
MPLTFNFGEENRPELFEGKPKTPVTLLSGFLGTGKTTLLKHLLENQDGVRIGVVVNDVAAVNIDSQLVRRYETGLVEVTELQNGCVCCSSADDLFTAVQNIVMRSKDYPFEHIVVELSGVGEPEAVKRNWAIAFECTMPVALRTEIKRVVTVVDASTFGRDWLDTRQAQERNEEVHGDKHDEKNTARLENVGQLLAEQVEWADALVVNMTDLASEEELRTTLEVVRALNSKASICQAEFGRVQPLTVLPSVPKGLRSRESGRGEGYSWSQTPSELVVRMPIDAAIKSRDVDLKVGKRTLRLGLKSRSAPRLEGKLSAELSHIDDVMFEIESSGSDRCVVLTLEKARAGMWPDIWDVKEEQEVVEGDDRPCGSGCGDPSHGHSHGAEHGHGHNGLSSGNRAEARFGIHSFAFRRRRPFSSTRLQALLKAWPTPRKELFSLADLDDDAEEVEVLTFDEVSEPSSSSRACPASAEKPCRPSNLDSVLRPVLRSKGFCWLDSEPLKQHVWSQAGRTLAVNPADWWWTSLGPEQLKFKVTYPGVEAEYEMARREKWDRETGDRRQELVFIGASQMLESAIVPLLEGCLLTDEEYASFCARTQALRVPDDEFHVNDLLKSLGAGKPEDSPAGRNETAEHEEEERLRRRKDREDTDFLRSLGVGLDLEQIDEANGPESFEAID